MRGTQGRALFLKEFFKNRKMVGSVAPSSRQLAKRMLRRVDIANAKIIVELGPGTGAITKEIISQMGENAKLISIEANGGFSERLAMQFPDGNVEFVHGKAEDIRSILAKRGIRQVDAFVSSLPLSLMSRELKESLMVEMAALSAPSGSYVQYLYSMHGYGLLKRYWKIVNRSIVWMNIPPSVVYTCCLR